MTRLFHRRLGAALLSPALAFLAVGTVSAGASAAAERDEPRASQEARSAHAETIMWRSSFASAMKEARESDRPLLLVFFTTWCAYCAKMHKTTLDAPEVMEAAGAFV